ncbi:MAG TPA: Ig-like domain-containing protein [Chloroflexia bacterium]|nr:Ig-like domain-containing protein [Chloroflexia bacterium]
MTCARYRALISRYLDDELTPRQRTELLDHIEHCSSCAADLAHFRQTELLLRKLPEGQPKPELKQAVLRAAKGSRRRQRRSLPWLLSAGGRFNPRLVAAALAVAVLLPVAASLVLPGPAGRAIARFGFTAPPTPTVAYLDVPASPTLPAGPLSPPRLLATSPYDGATEVDPHASLLVRFDQPMDRRSVEHAFLLSPPVPGAFRWEADNQVRFQPGTDGLLPGITYTVALTDSARALAGGLLAPTTVWTFRTVAGPHVAAVAPAPGATGVPAGTTLVITFSQPVDTANVERLVRLAPAVAPAAPPVPARRDPPFRGAVAWSDDHRVLRLAAETPIPAGPVRVTLDAGVHASQGGDVPPVTWEFGVQPPDNRVTFEGPLWQSRPTGTSAQVAYRAVANPEDRDAGNVRFALYPVPREHFENLLPSVLAWQNASPHGLRAAAGDQPPIRTWAGYLRIGRSSERNPTAAGLFTTTLPLHEPGLYWLTATIPGGQGDTRLIALGDEGLVLFGGAGRWYVWVSSLTSGAPIPGAQVRLYDAGGKVLGAGASDAQGLFSVPLAANQIPALALADHDGTISFATLDAEEGTRAVSEVGDSIAATLILDQARYEAGGTVLFTAQVHAPTVGDTVAAVAVRMRDPDGQEIDVLTLQPDAQGMLQGSFPIAPGSRPGLYSLELSLDGHEHHEWFAVDPPTPAGQASLQLRLTVPPAPLYAGDTVTATVDAAYGPGQPAASVTAVLDLRIADAHGDASAKPGLVLTATMDADGRIQVPIRLPPQPGGNAAAGATRWVLTARAADPLGRVGRGVAWLNVLPGRAQVQQTLNTRAFAPGDTVIITSTVRDAGGNPRAGQPVAVRLWVGGGEVGVARGGSLLSSITSVTGPTGMATATLALPLQGSYQVQSVITDSTGVQVDTITPIWVYSAGSGASWAVAPAPPAGATLTADQGAYHPDETAHLLVQAPGAEGGLLLTRLAGRVVGVQSVRLPGGAGTIAVAVPASIAGADQLNLEFTRFVAGGSGPRFSTAVIALALQPADDTQLSVTLPAPASPGYRPGTALPLDLSLRGNGNLPGSAAILIRVSAAIPDEAGPGDNSPPSSSLQGRTKAWRTDVALNAAGEVTTPLQLPAESGFWNLDVWAFTASGVIHTRQILQTVAPLDLRWSMPGALVEGDSTSVMAEVRNDQTLATNVILVLQPAGKTVELASPAEQTMHLEPGEQRTTIWLVRAGAPGSVEVRLDANWGAPGAPGEPIHRSQRVTVAPYGIADEQTQAGVIAESETINMSLPADLDQAGASLEVHTAPTLIDVVAAAVAALDPSASEPDGAPVEAAAARLLAGAAVQSLYRGQGLAADDLPTWVGDGLAADVAALYSAQQPGGGWGAAPGAPADAAATSHVLEACWELAHAGNLQVDTRVTTRAIDWLRPVADPPAELGSTGPGASLAVETTAEAIYVLSLYGEAERGSVDRLLAREPQLPARARALLALALAQSGRADEAHLVVDRLASIAADSRDPRVLDALLTAGRAGSQGPVVSMVRAVLAERSGAAWRTPAISATSLRAISRYALAVPDTARAAGYRVLVNGQVVGEVPAGEVRGGRQLQILVPGSRLRTGDNSVRFETSQGPLYYSLRARAVLASSEHPITTRRAEGAPASLLRVYQPGPGGVTTVVLTLTLTVPLDGLLLDDPLPGGLAPLPGVSFARVEGTQDQRLVRDWRAAIWPGGEHPEGSGFAASMGPLPPGQYVLTYRAVTVAPGTYSALPALAVPSADPTLWVRSGGDNLLLNR